MHLEKVVRVLTNQYIGWFVNRANQPRTKPLPAALCINEPTHGLVR
jgi:hypothetical protein